MAWSEKFWCGRGDSNPHALRRHPLKMVRLPVPPLPHGGERKHCIREQESSQAIGFDSGEFTAAALRLQKARKRSASIPESLLRQRYGFFAGGCCCGAGAPCAPPDGAGV